MMSILFKWMVGFLTGIFAAVLSSILLGFGLHGLTPLAATLALLIGLATGIYGGRSTSPLAIPIPTLSDSLLIATFLFASFRAFFWITNSVGPVLFITSPYNLGDLSLHLNFIQYLASGAPFWPSSPLLSGESLRYPIGVDLLNSLLLLQGIPIESGLIGVAILGSGLTVMSLWWWGRGFAIATFLFTGGLLGFSLFRYIIPEFADIGNWIQHSTSTASHPLYPSWNLSTQTELIQQLLSIPWKNFFLALFIPQRSFLLALPVLLLLLSDWRREFLQLHPPQLSRWVSLLLYSTLPLYQLHLFFFLSIMLLGIFLSSFLYTQPLTTYDPSRTPIRPHRPFVIPLSTNIRQLRWKIIHYVALAFLPACICTAWVTAGFQAAGGIHWQPGWLQEGPFWSFWLSNFGIALPLSCILILKILSNTFKAAFSKLPTATCSSNLTASIPAPDRESLPLVVTASLLFLLCCWISFAPWAWDNTKIQMACWITLAPYLWKHLLQPLPFIPRAFICFGLFFTGFLTLSIGLSGKTYPLIERQELDNTTYSLRFCAPGSRFATAAEYNHPLFLLGQKLAAGYEGHLWSHGLSYQEKMALLDRLMTGQPGWKEAAKALQVDYLYWGPRERARYPQSLCPWIESQPKVYQGGEVIILEL